MSTAAILELSGISPADAVISGISSDDATHSRMFTAAILELSGISPPDGYITFVLFKREGKKKKDIDVVAIRFYPHDVTA